MKQGIPTPPLVYPIDQTARLFGKSNRNFVYRAAARGELEIVKIGVRSSAVTRCSILRFAESRSIPLPADF